MGNTGAKKSDPKLEKLIEEVKDLKQAKLFEDAKDMISESKELTKA